MANFTLIQMEANTGTNGAPTWTNVTGTLKGIRLSDISTAGLTTAPSAWPEITLPPTPTGVDYLYAYTDMAVGLGFLGTGGVPTAFSTANFNQLRWRWDSVGSFAAAPIMSAYPTSAHSTVTAGDKSILGGSADTNNKSYYKAQAWGRVASAGGPTSGPGTPLANDGTVGSLSPNAGAFWMPGWQDLQGINDYITAPFTPAGATADSWPVMFRAFVGTLLQVGTLTPVLSLRYAYT